MLQLTLLLSRCLHPQLMKEPIADQRQHLLKKSITDIRAMRPLYQDLSMPHAQLPSSRNATFYTFQHVARSKSCVLWKSRELDLHLQKSRAPSSWLPMGALCEHSHSFKTEPQ